MVSDEAAMRVAIAQGKIALHNGYLPVGAVIVYKGEIVSVANKSEGESPRLDHAEIVAIRRFLALGHSWLNDATLYTTLEPCVMCEGAILNVNAARLVYAVEDPYGGAASMGEMGICPRHDESHQITAGFMRQEALPFFQEFLRVSENDFWRQPIFVEAWRK